MVPASAAALLGFLILKVFRYGSRLSGLLVFTSTALWLLATFVSQQFQMSLWWLNADDDVFFEGVAHNLIEFGPDANPIAVAADGLPSVAYHHLSYFFAGLLEVVSGSQDFLSLTRTSVFLLSMSLSATLILAVQQVAMMSHAKMVTVRSTALACLVVFFSPLMSPGPLSNFLGNLSILVALVLGLEIRSRSPRLALATVSISIISAAMFSKATAFYAVFLLVFMCALASTLTRRIVTFSLIGGLALMLFLFSRAPSRSDLALSWFNPDSLGELAAGGGPHRVLALASVLAPLILGLLAAVLLVFQPIYLALRLAGYALLLVMLIGYITRFTVGGRIETIRYWWEPAPLAASVMVAVWLAASHGELPNRFILGIASLAVVLAGVWYFFLPRVIPNLNSGSIVAKFLRLLLSPDAIPLATGLAVSLLAVGGLHKVSNQHLAIAISRQSMAAVLIIGGMAGAGALRLTQSIAEEMRDISADPLQVEKNAWFGSPDLQEIGSFIKLRTPSDSLLALTLCNPSRDTCPNQYEIATFSERRFLSLGGTFFTSWNQEEHVLADYSLSTEIATRAPSEVAGALRRRGVDLLVVDNRFVPSGWGQVMSRSGFDQVFINDGFSLLALPKVDIP